MVDHLLHFLSSVMQTPETRLIWNCVLKKIKIRLKIFEKVGDRLMGRMLLLPGIIWKNQHSIEGTRK